MKIKGYVSALRLRTLPLSLSGVSLGAMLAAADYNVDFRVALFVLLTAAFLQLLSNVCNELGDYRRGVSSAHERYASAALKDGTVSEQGMKVLVRILTALSICSGLIMIYLTFGSLFLLESFILMVFGYLAIRAAVNYTLGSNPYGYRGLGDLYVFLYFGIVAVWGSYYVCSHSFGTMMLALPACAVGFFSVGVLNVNNIRDISTDMACRKTVAVRLGERRTKIYQTVLLVLGWVSMLSYSCLRIFDPWHFIFIITLPLFAWHLVMLWKYQGPQLDRGLPLLVLSVLAFSLLSGLGFIMFLYI